ncbi:MAG: hypothetical protein NVV66_18425 [Cellulomonas sp.]|uniref:hypothetical protein n=1 Tax=Cellulomonas sp. TaxID=40001 RepID=UPI0025871561|nr:hypothetical protein [Cellulomonas sp.]MCR6706574.1 hypothetical protein [Cellulomonas sp.]
MAQATRKVYFLEPVVVNPDDSIEDIRVGFWPELHKRVSTLPTRDRFMTFNGIRYGGSARSETSPVADYLYLGLRRRPADFPDHAPDDASDEEALDVPGSLVEPMYVREVPGTNLAAFFRTSGGPSFRACERWISQVLGLGGAGAESIGLRPYVRGDALRRLADSDGVAKLEIKFEPDALRGNAAGQGIASALSQIDEIGAGGVSIELGVSFGQARPSEIGAERYARELERLLETPGIRRAEATLLTARPKPAKAGQSQPEYSFQREHVNFLRDQVVHNVRLSSDETVRRTPSLVLSAMGEAVQEFLKDLRRPPE